MIRHVNLPANDRGYGLFVFFFFFITCFLSAKMARIKRKDTNLFLTFYVLSLFFCTFAQIFLFMTRKSIIFIAVMLLTTLLGRAQEHTRFLDLPLDMRADSLVDLLSRRGLVQEDAYELSGRIAGLHVWITVVPAKDTSRVSRIVMSTRQQQGHSQRDDFKALMRWLHHHYGAPTWESSVRGHAFARWFVDFDRDIVLIATAHEAVEVWFYEDHSRRHYDYYAILKYCERNPSEDVPFYTARECVTWHDSVARPVVRKFAKGRKVKARAKTRARARIKARAKAKGKRKTRRR